MPLTLENIRIPPNQWVNLYATSGIEVGKAISVDNVGVCDVRLAVSGREPMLPTTESSAHQILSRDGLPMINSEGDPGAWVYCPNNTGLINVSSVDGQHGFIPASSPEADTDQDFNASLFSSIEGMRQQLCLLNARFEETFETGINIEDVE